jgi:uncharacterized protein
MQQVRVIQADSRLLLASSVAVADSFRHRLRGLLARPPLEAGQGLLLLECRSVHTVGMRFPIDVAFLDLDGTVVRSIAGLGPWRVGLGGSRAVHALELPAGRLSETATVPGVRLQWN